MDTLSTSLKVSALPSTLSNREFYNFKATSTRSQPQPQPHHVFSTSTSTSSPRSFSHKSSSSLPFPLKAKSSSPIFHPNPATGYAAALVDVAHNTNSLHFVHNDVQRLFKLLQKAPNLQLPAVHRGNFHRHLVALLNVLLNKNKVGIVKEVLLEFERIYDDLCGTQMVLVSSTTKMGKDQLFGIAKSVHQFSGAGRVKVRNFVQDTVPSFAV